LPFRHHGESRYRESRNQAGRNTLLGQALSRDRWSATLAFHKDGHNRNVDGGPPLAR
jgi:hypothetical protein